MEEDDMQTSANSELRFMTLELMRLAQKSNKSFEQVAGEFIANTILLQDMITGEAEGRAKAKARKERQSYQK